MRHVAFHADSVVATCAEGGGPLVGLAGQGADSARYLLLQRACSFDPQDRALGMETYHVEWCSQSASRYGGIERCTLGPASVEILFAKDAGAALGGLGRLSVSFRLAPGEHARLAKALGEVFAGCGCLVMADG